MLTNSIIEITETNLHSAIEQSLKKLVVFYFWSERSQHHQQLLPILDSLTKEYTDQFTLATVDCDNQPMIAAQFGIRSIPTVYLLKDGQPVDGFQGPQSEQFIRDMLGKFLPKPEDLKLEQARLLLEEDDQSAALSLLIEAHQLNSKRSDISLLLAETYLKLNQREQAESLLATIPIEDRDSHYQGLIAQIDLMKQAADTPEIKQLQQQLQHDPQNYELGVKLALQLHEVGRNEEALELLMSYMKVDLNTANGSAKKMLLDILSALGTNSSLANQYRRQLYSLLY